jgi:hypothetical protein
VIDDLVTSAGFVLERISRSYEPGSPRPFGFLYEGLARR